MLSLVSQRQSRNCEGATRRDFIKVGSLGLGGLTLPALLEARAQAAAAGREIKDTSVIWLWLSGGPTHVETFDPKMTAPVEFRSVTGEVRTSLTGVTIGGTFPKIAAMADEMVFVRSFAHGNNGHRGGTHWLMTGQNNRRIDNGNPQSHPSTGSILARIRGANHSATGVPTYVALGRIDSGGPAYLGAAYEPFNPRGQALRNMALTVEEQRFGSRRELLSRLDRIDRQIDQSGLMDALSNFEQQAYGVILGNARKAFDLKHEDPKLVERYGKGLGQQLLQARRLCEAGCGFVTINYGGWDMHGNIKRGIESRSPQLDHAVATYLQDVTSRGLSKKILLVISGEFGRTPRVNKSAGRDHWARLSTLALAGGGLQMGQVVGESARHVDVPKTNPITPQDLMATVFHVLGIDQKIDFLSRAGRPIRPIDSGRPISELV